MKIETVKIPKTFKELEKLSKDRSVMVIYNVYPTLCSWYESMKKQPDESFKFDNCWKIKPLADIFEKGKPDSVFYRIVDGNNALIRIK